MLRSLFRGALALVLFGAPASAQTYHDSNGTVINGVVPLVGCSAGANCSGPASNASPLPVSVSGPTGASTTPANAVAGVAPDGANGFSTATTTTLNAWGNGSSSSLSTLGYNSLQFSVNGSFSGVTAEVDGSVDGGLTWWPLAIYSPGSGGCSTASAGAAGNYIVFDPPPLVRLNLTAFGSGSYSSGYALRSNTGAAIWICTKSGSASGAILQGNAGSVWANVHAATGSATSSLLVKSALGNLYNITASGIVGGSAGYLVVINAASVPSPGASLTPIDVCYIPTGAAGCTISHGSLPINYTTGIVALITSASTPFTYTTGTDTGFIGADYQ